MTDETLLELQSAETITINSVHQQQLAHAVEVATLEKRRNHDCAAGTDSREAHG